MSSPVFLSDSVYFHFGTASATTGAATNADSTPTVTIAEDGVDMGYAPSVANVTTGLYIVTIAATAGNGFEAGKRYSVYATATVGGIAGRDGIAEFEVLAVDLNTGVASVTGAVGSVTAGVTVTTNNDKTGYGLSGTQTFNNTGTWTGSLTGSVGSVTGSVGSVVGLTVANLDVAVSTRMATFSVPTNFSAMSITAAGVVDADIKYVNAILVTGAGTGASPWGP